MKRVFLRYDEKRSPDILQYIIWARKRDLFAGVTAAGDVFISRMSWKRVWTIKSAKFDQASITAMTWKPDATALAIGTSHGEVYIMDIETSDLTHLIYSSPHSQSSSCHGVIPYDRQPKITTLHWVDDIKITTDSQYNVWQPPLHSYMEYLPALSALPRPGSLVPQIDGDSENKSETMHVLVIGDDSGQFSLTVDGAFHLGRTSMSSFSNLHLKDVSIIRASLTTDLRILTLVLSAATSSTPDRPLSPLALTRNELPTSAPTSPVSTTFKRDIYLATIDTNLLHLRKKEVCSLAYRSTQSSSLLHYLEDGINLLKAEYTNVNNTRALHMETYKRILNNYGSGSTPYDEMVTMLWIGHRSSATRQYLQHDLGERLLTKWESIVSTTYLTMKKLILINLRPGAQRLLLFLTELYGLSRFEEGNQTVGLNVNRVRFCLKRAGQLMAAFDRLITVLNDDTNFSVFVGWLKQLSSPEINEVNSSGVETSRVAEYLKKSFQHDMLGPFFKDSEAASALDSSTFDKNSNNDNNFSSYFYDLDSAAVKELSLLTIMADLKRVSGAIFDAPAAFIGSKCHLEGVAKVLSAAQMEENVKIDMRLVSGPTGMVQYLLFKDSVSEFLQECCLIRFSARLRKPPKGSVSGYESLSGVKWSGEGVRLTFVDTDGDALEIMDVQFYDDEGLVVLARAPQGQKQLYMLPSYSGFAYQKIYSSGVPTLEDHLSVVASSNVPTTSITLESPYNIERLDPVALSVHKDFVSLLNTDKSRIRVCSIVDADDVGNSDEENEEGADNDE